MFAKGLSFALSVGTLLAVVVLFLLDFKDGAKGQQLRGQFPN